LKENSLMSFGLNRRWLAVSLVLAVMFLSARLAFAFTGDTTTVVIIGTVHNKTDNYTAEKLYGIIERVKPDLILVELDSSFLTPSMSIKPEFVGVSLENMVVSDYQKTHEVPIRPYDIEGRNKIYQQHNYFRLQQDLSRALDRAAEDSLLHGEAAMLLDAIVRFDGIGRAFGLETPEVINSDPCDVAMESKQYYGNDGMFSIVTSVPALRQFAEFATFKRDFWIVRNDAMMTDILRWAKLLHPKTVLVLCGFEHRYYLRNALKMQSTRDKFLLRDFWTY
jgi:hypothetical protein